MEGSKKIVDGKEVSIPIERLEKSIMLIRGKKVLMDRHLTVLYGVETAQLKRAVLNSTI